MLLLGIVQQQAELHALAGELAVGQRAHAGQDRGEAGLRLGLDAPRGLAAGAQLPTISSRSATSRSVAAFR